ncbi:hypothetical protein BW722_02210 [Lawsonia intracellularis]|uniref:hypothetical protein n=1 Tax=Lawsonia intracellularis TaxID=29546 RepID=UPI000977E718|nr:hypothetical protein [Lawsonia intracellularis]OMQ04592.1 hypothetical protein BW722_02210 [Lawsonia intracellularis]
MIVLYLACYSVFCSLNNEGLRNSTPLKIRQNKALRIGILSTGVFACIGDGEDKRDIFFGKMANGESEHKSNAGKTLESPQLLGC